jgi:protoporphyrinogen oxidase
MVEPGTACLGVEYFCFAGDPIWEMPEADAVAHAVDELAQIGLLDPARVTGGTRIRVEKSYPTYDASYREAVAVLRAYLGGLVNLQTFGRNGLHRYNNQDHSMWTAALAAANAVDGGSRDVWSVNTDALYAEEWTLVEDVPELSPPPRVAAPATLATEGSLV